LASSPGRIVGDSLGRWAVGAVTKEGPAATLHVLAVPKAPIASGVVARADAAISSAPSLLVESQVPATAVIQLLSTLAAPHTPADNALVLTSRHS
ncbi:unnamed protein product, partial [Sphacelaria rigidula]